MPWGMPRRCLGIHAAPVTQESAEPLTFEVGAGDVMGNALFQAFDEAVLGMALGDEATVSAVSGEYDRDLLFAVRLLRSPLRRCADPPAAAAQPLPGSAGASRPC